MYYRVLRSNVNHARDSLVHFNNISIMLWKFYVFMNINTHKRYRGKQLRIKYLLCVHSECFPIFRKVCPCLCLLPHLKTWSPPPHLPMAFTTHRCYSVFVCLGLGFYFICFVFQSRPFLDLVFLEIVTSELLSPALLVPFSPLELCSDLPLGQGSLSDHQVYFKSLMTNRQGFT